MFDGIYTAYLTGQAGQAIAIFVFKDEKIAGADMAGLIYSGEYKLENGRVKGSIDYKMPANSSSITGATFIEPSETITVHVDLPETIEPNQTYEIATPIGPLNAKFVKNTEL